MKAIVLSFDKQAGFVELLYKKYAELWSDCPLSFRIPVNNRETYSSYEYFKSKDNVELIDSPIDIKSTMISLLAGLSDDEWVYWCIDDRFPIEIKNVQILNSIVNDLESGRHNDLKGIKLFRWREALMDNVVDLGGEKFQQQQPRTLYGFWLHSFVKVSVLKEIFLSSELPEEYKITDITTVFYSKEFIASFENTVVPENDIVLMGEPCVDGEITTNGLEELKKYNCPIPDYTVLPQNKRFTDKWRDACSDVKRSYTHVLNPVGVSEESEFYNIQQVTFAAMKRAFDVAKGLDLDLMSVQYEEDHSIIPDYFKKTPDLTSSVLDVKDFTKKRKLPFIGDILERVHKYSSAEYVIFTNVDIIPSPEFYLEIDRMVEEGNTAFTINRRTVKRYPDSPDNLDAIFEQKGASHPGHDCFVFPRKWIESFVLGRIIVGAPWVGFSILANMACVGRGINIFQDLSLTRHLGDDQQWQSPENLEYRDFNSYEALVLLAALQKEYGSFQPGGYLAQHVLLAIQQVKSAGTIVDYVSKRHTNVLDKKRKLIFSVSSGRAGSEYLKEVIGSAENVRSFHEPKPSMSGVPLRDVMMAPMENSYNSRKKKTDALIEDLSHYTPSAIYAETNHMFIKTFYDVIMEELSDCNVSVVVLRRSLPKVLKSFVKMGYFTDKNEAWPMWMHQVPSSNTVLKPLKKFSEMDQYDRSIAYLLDVEMRAQEFIRIYGDRCNVVEIDLNNIQSISDVKDFFAKLDLISTPLTESVVGSVVNDRSDRKKEISIDTDLQYCSERISKFIKEHRDSGIEIPTIPQFE